MRMRAFGTAVLAVLLPAVALAWGSPPASPGDTVVLPPQLGSIELWPYTGTDFDSSMPSDPVNLFFVDVDPRAVRQALMALPGDRSMVPAGVPAYPNQPPFNCTWADAMGYEQTGWAQTEGWVGSEIQLVCIDPAAPFGNPFRFHLRLFRQGTLTVGAAHFELLIPGTAEHEVLSWDFARDFVALDAWRAGLFSTPPPAPVGLLPMGFFRTIRYAVYKPLYDAAQAPTPEGVGLMQLLMELQLPVSPTPLPPDLPVPIPITGYGLTLVPDFVFEPAPERIHTRYAADYDVVAPKPFCNPTGTEYVRLEGRLRFDLRVYGDWAGRFLREYDIKGHLEVTPWNPIDNVPAGKPAPAKIRESHAAVLTDSYGQLYEKASQELLGRKKQSLSWFLAAGELDRYFANEQCGGGRRHR